MENLTAKISCFARAYHYKTNERPIFGDSAAAALLGGDYDAIAAHIAQGIQFFAPGFTGSADEARLGCRQYVLFAAGYDTFALRAPVQGLRVYELDQPGLIEDKKRRIERSSVEEKTAVEYIPCDLADCGFLIYEQLDDEEMTKRYFAPCRDDMRAPKGVNYILAVKKR